MRYLIRQSTKTGIYFIYEYTPRVERLRGKSTDSTVFSFKTSNSHAEEFSLILKGIKTLFEAETTIALPGSTLELLSVQKIADTDVNLRAVTERKSKRIHKIKLTKEEEQNRFVFNNDPSIELPLNHVILVDDVCNTGETLHLYDGILKESGVYKTSTLFAFGHSPTEFENTHAIIIVDTDELMEWVTDYKEKLLTEMMESL